MTDNRARRPAIILAFLILATILIGVTACGNRPERPPGPPEKITIAYSRTFIALLLEIARARGYFEIEGLEVTPQIHEFGKIALQSVLRGNADVACAADTPIMFSIGEGRQVFVLAMVSKSWKANAIVARRDRGIAVPRDLKGKRIGVPLGTTGQFFLDSFLAVRGIDRKAVKTVDLRPGEMVDALLKGRIDAVSLWQPTIAQAREALKDQGLVFYDEVVYSDIGCIAAAPECVQKRPEAVRRLLRALIRADEFMKENPREAKGLAAALLTMDRSQLDDLWGSFDFTVVLDQSLVVSLESQMRWAQRNGLIGATEMPDYRDFIYVDGLRAVKPEAVRIIR